MNTLLLINETYSNGYRDVFLDIIYIASVLFGISVIISKNPIISVLFLISLFVSIACYLLILGMNFIGLSYLLVYVGAVSILFLFILMLINVRVSELLSETSKSLPLALIITVSFSYPVNEILPNKHSNHFPTLFRFFNNNDDTMFVTSKLWDGNLAEVTHIHSIGNIMYSSHSIWLIITSIILLLAMVGAIVITIKQKNQIETLV